MCGRIAGGAGRLAPRARGFARTLDDPSVGYRPGPASRRGEGSGAAAFALLAALAAAIPPAAAQAVAPDDAPDDPLRRIAVVAPLGDRGAVLGEQVLRGAGEALGMPPGAARGQGSGVGPDGVEIVTVSDPCRGGDEADEDGAQVAEDLLAADADAAVGLICWGTLRAALREGTLDGLPLLTTGVRAAELTDRARAEGWEVWRLAPRAEAEAEAVAAHIFARWRDRPYAVIDDGTIYGRELAASVLGLLLARGSEPVLADTFRPAISRQFGLVRRLQGAGPSHLFVAGERRDVAIIARDAAAAGLDLTVLGGDALRAVDDDVPLPTGVEGIVLGPALAEGYEAPTRAAVEVLLAAAETARRDGITLPDALDAGAFETAIGPVRFDARRDVRGNPFVHAVWNGERFVPTPPAPVPDAMEVEPTDGTAPDGASAPASAVDTDVPGTEAAGDAGDSADDPAADALATTGDGADAPGAGAGDGVAADGAAPTDSADDAALEFVPVPVE